MRTSECRGIGCQAPIIWTETVDGRKLCLDAEPDEKGTWTIDIVHNGGARSTYNAVAIVNNPDFQGKKYVPHWATCKARGQFRRKGGRR